MPHHATAVHHAGHSPTLADTASPWSWVALRDAIARMQERRRQRRDAQDLHLLSEHMLRDIGIGRSEITFSIEAGRAAR